MVLNTASVGAAVTPAVIGTFISHYTNRKPRTGIPTAHISYDEGLHLIRKFLEYASHHTVEELQRFTGQWVPHPRWVKVDVVTIGEEHVTAAAEAIQAQLGHHGIEKVGGKSWWQWRRPGSELTAEWIEMRSDYQERKRLRGEVKRVMLYVHGGAYFFGSVDEHRYQMQRHARKLKARVLARKIARYRLAPQFPFPCGLHDCLSAYMYLLTVQDPTTIIVAGDSAGGGMIVSMLVTLRDRGIPLPAGAILISPWVDLTHSFPSVAGDNPFDFIPSHGFHSRPSPAWPPPNSDDMLAMAEGAVKQLTHEQPMSQITEQDAVQGFHVNEHPDAGIQNDTAATGTVSHDGTGLTANTVPGHGHALSIILDGNLIEIKDQIQMYATNQLISHPLVSPILQPSLGGLPPLLILTGGGEMLRDEQIYLAHKAANPLIYPPGDAFLDENAHDHNRNQVDRWKPTDVQLQVWDDLCHVAPTLSFTRPAKYMYRSIAQFGAWALARAQHAEIEILDDDDVSIISKSESQDGDEDKDEKHAKGPGHVGKAGDPLPPFKNHMIRQRVTRHGSTYPLEPASKLPGCNLPRSQIGVIKEGPVRKWMKAKREWDTKFASSKRRVQKERAKEMMEGYQTFGDGEVPPPSALAGRRRKGDQDREKKNKRSWGLSLWSMWGSKHDKKAKEREEEFDRLPETMVVTEEEGANSRPLYDTEAKKGELKPAQRNKSSSRSRSRRRTVTDQNQTDQPEEIGESPTEPRFPGVKKAEEGIRREDSYNSYASGTSSTFPPRKGRDEGLELEDEKNECRPQQPRGISTLSNPVIFEPTEDELPSNIEISKTNRPKSNGIAFPFRLGRGSGHKSAAGSVDSTSTLTSALGVPPAKEVRGSKKEFDAGVAEYEKYLKANNIPNEPGVKKGSSFKDKFHIGRKGKEPAVIQEEDSNYAPTGSQKLEESGLSEKLEERGQGHASTLGGDGPRPIPANVNPDDMITEYVYW